MYMFGSSRAVEADATEPASSVPRGLIDRRLAAAVFVVITAGVPLHAVQALRDAIDEPALRAWMLFVDATLKTLLMTAFAVFIYKRKPSRSPARSPLAFLACAAAILPAIWLAPLPGADAALWAIVAGESLVILAGGFTLASVLCLGTCFGVLPEVRGLVMRGPYRYVRHPVYVGEILAFAGFVLASQRLTNIVPLIVFVAAQMVRLRMEEKVLRAEFPQEYGAFAARTPRLVPRLRAGSRLEHVPSPTVGEAVAPVPAA